MIIMWIGLLQVSHNGWKIIILNYVILMKFTAETFELDPDVYYCINSIFVQKILFPFSHSLSMNIFHLNKISLFIDSTLTEKYVPHKWEIISLAVITEHNY